MPDALAASCSRPIATGERLSGLAQEIRQRLLAFRRREFCDQFPRLEVGTQRHLQGRLPLSDRLAQLGRQRIDRAAFDAGSGHDGFAADVCSPNVSATPLSGWPSKRSRKTSDQATVKPLLAGRSVDIFTPFAARVQPMHHPIPAAASLRHRVPARLRASRRRAVHPAFENEDGPARPSRSSGDAARVARPSIQPPQPGPQQRRCLEGFWKNPPAGADKRFLPQRLAPVAQRLWRERFDGRCEMRHRLAVARKECGKRFAVREVEPASPGHQEFAAGRRHRVIDGDAAPPCASTSAAIRPAGPAPMTAIFFMGDDMVRQVPRHSGMRRRAQTRNPLSTAAGGTYSGFDASHRPGMTPSPTA